MFGICLCSFDHVAKDKAVKVFIGAGYVILDFQKPGLDEHLIISAKGQRPFARGHS